MRGVRWAADSTVRGGLPEAEGRWVAVRGRFVPPGPVGGWRGREVSLREKKAEERPILRESPTPLTSTGLCRNSSGSRYRGT
jgi:hypothetical protein